MHWSRPIRTAGVMALAATAAALMGAQPAAADITVDSAVCLNNATGTLTSPDPVIRGHRNGDITYPLVTWHATTGTTYCRAANASLSLAFVPDARKSFGLPVTDGSTYLFDEGRWVLRVRTSLGQKDLASIVIT